MPSIALWAYVGFLGVSWFTWLQIMLFDIRFARDSIFERTCKVLQLAAMIGFVSAGSSFASRAIDENLWAFVSLSFLLAATRLMLAIEYLLALRFVHRKLPTATRGLTIIVTTLAVASAIYATVSIFVPSIVKRLTANMIYNRYITVSVTTGKRNGLISGWFGAPCQSWKP